MLIVHASTQDNPIESSRERTAHQLCTVILYLGQHPLFLQAASRGRHSFSGTGYMIYWLYWLQILCSDTITPWGVFSYSATSHLGVLACINMIEMRIYFLFYQNQTISLDIIFIILGFLIFGGLRW